MRDYKVLVLEDLLVIREGLVRLVEQIPGLQMGRACQSAEEALEEVALQRYDLVLSSLQPGAAHGIVVGRALLRAIPDLKVIIYAREASHVLAAEVFRYEYSRLNQRRSRSRAMSVTNYAVNSPLSLPLPATGLHAYLLLKHLTPPVIEQTLTLIQEQNQVIDPEVQLLLLERLQRQNLTPRETECCELISQGKSNQEVAGQLGITRQAVENLINSLYNKFSIGGEPKDPGRRVLLSQAVQRWEGLGSASHAGPYEERDQKTA